MRLVPGGVFTTQVFGQLQPRALLRVQGPLGAFFLRDVFNSLRIRLNKPAINSE